MIRAGGAGALISVWMIAITAIITSQSAIAQPITHTYFGVAALNGEYERSGTFNQDDFALSGFDISGFESYQLEPQSDEDQGWHLVYGYQFRKHFAVEAQFFDAGEYKQAGVHEFENFPIGNFVIDEETDELGLILESGQGRAVTSVRQRGLAALGVAIWPVTQQFSVRAKLGFALVSNESDIQVRDVRSVFTNEGEVILENDQRRISGSRTETDLPVVLGVEAKLRWGRDWGLSVFWQRQNSVGGGIFGEDADLDVTGVQLTYHL